MKIVGNKQAKAWLSALCLVVGVIVLFMGSVFGAMLCASLALTWFGLYLYNGFGAPDINHTIIIGSWSSECGRCGENAFPDDQTVCTSCGTTWLFMAALHYYSNESMDETAQRFEGLFPHFRFVGVAARGNDGAYDIYELYQPTASV